MEEERTKKPSEIKPWLKLFDREIPDEKSTECTVFKYLYDRNKDGLSDIALNYIDNEISFGDLFKNIQQTARALAEYGVKKGDVVTVCSVMTPEIIYLFYAMDLIGATPNMVDPRTSTQGVHEYIEEVGSELVCTLSVAYPRLKKASEDTKVKNILVVSPADSLKGIKKPLYKLANKDKNEYDERTLFWKDFFEKGNNGKADYDTEYDDQHAAVIVHTGGTTGIPKGVLLGDKAFNALALQYGINGFERRHRFLNVMPPFIAYGFACGVHLPLSHGVASVLIPQLDPEKLGSLLLKYKPSHMAGVPLHYQTIARDKKLKNSDLSFLKTSGVGGDAINTGAEQEVNDFLLSHGCPYKLCKGYGMTECCSTAATNMGPNNKLGSIGYPLCLTTIGIFEPGTENELGFNQDGEICITGPNLMLGYFNKPAETADVLRTHTDGKVWLHTGDIGRMDEDGFIFIDARIKRIIIRHDGFKIFPSAIENVVGAHPDVECCAAVSTADKEHLQGKLPIVHVVLKKNISNSVQNIETEIKSLCEKDLAEYAQPVGFKFRDTLPYTPIGKVDYLALEAEE